MSCAITSGRQVPCKNKSGSLKTVYFADFGTLGAVTESAGLISALGGSPTWYQFDVRGTSNLDSTVTSSRENGTTFYTQTLTLQLQYYDRATSEQIKLLAVGRPHIVVVDADDNHLVVGKVNGAELTTGKSELDVRYYWDIVSRLLDKFGLKHLVRKNPPLTILDKSQKSLMEFV